MANILLTRIDNRLIHGQIAVAWTNHVGANLIIVVNDEVAEDDFQQSLMDMAVPEGVGVRYFTVQETIDKIPHASEQQKVFIIARTPQDVLALIDGGVMIREVNIGNMHYAEGKRQLTSTVSIDKDDEETFKKLHEKGVKLEIRRVPEERGQDILKLI